MKLFYKEKEYLHMTKIKILFVYKMIVSRNIKKGKLQKILIWNYAIFAI